MSAWIKDLAYIVSGTVNPPWYVNVEFDGDALWERLNSVWSRAI
ncbi:hypothetical protein [Shimia sp. MMG029]|nr:hypothetical protein [Shimia sp. MMG029]MDA5556820.1 hypothetical protein [Shimia sp. MMG029]